MQLYCCLYYLLWGAERQYELWDIAISLHVEKCKIKLARLNKKTWREKKHFFIQPTPILRQLPYSDLFLQEVFQDVNTIQFNLLQLFFPSLCLSSTHTLRTFLLRSSHFDGWLSCIIINTDIWECRKDMPTNPHNGLQHNALWERRYR